MRENKENMPGQIKYSGTLSNHQQQRTVSGVAPIGRADGRVCFRGDAEPAGVASGCWSPVDEDGVAGFKRTHHIAASIRVCTMKICHVLRPSSETHDNPATATRERCPTSSGCEDRWHKTSRGTVLIGYPWPRACASRLAAKNRRGRPGNYEMAQRVKYEG